MLKFCALNLLNTSSMQITFDNLLWTTIKQNVGLEDLIIASVAYMQGFGSYEDLRKE